MTPPPTTVTDVLDALEAELNVLDLARTALEVAELLGRQRIDAVRSVLDHGDHEAAIAARSRGGSRTRTRQRFTHLAELTGWSES